MLDEIEKKLSSNKNVKRVTVKNIVRVITQVEAGPSKAEDVRKEIYDLELELMKEYPDALFDFHVTSH